MEALIGDYGYYDIFLLSIPIILIIVVIIFRLIHGNEQVDFIGLSPLTIIEIASKEMNNIQLEELDSLDIINRDNELTKGDINLNLLPSGRFDSKGEQECRRALEEMFGKEFKKVNPVFLTNPKTKRRLELDCYNEDLRLAVEYQGYQHYEWPNKYHTYEEFKRQLWRDDLKVELCKQNNVYLIRVPHTIKISKIKQFIYDNLPLDLQFIADQNMQ